MNILLRLAAPALITAIAGCVSVSAPAPTAGTHTVTVVADGMVCNFCATNIDRTLGKLPGVTAVYVDLHEGSVLLGVNDPDLPTEADIRRAVGDAGFTFRGIRRAAVPFAEAQAALKTKEAAPGAR
jgi:copper chaperone CopZ